MMPASTKGQLVGAMAAATRSTVFGLMALHSTKTGFALLAVSAGTKRSANDSASPGGRIDRMKSVAAISSSVAVVIPAALARDPVSLLRPLSEVRTLTPLSTSLFPTAAPIMPGAMTATTGIMLASLYETRLTIPACIRQELDFRGVGSSDGLAGVRRFGAALQPPPQRRGAAVGAGLIVNAVAPNDFGEDPRVGRLLHLE